MVTPALRELAGPFPSPSVPNPWFLPEDIAHRLMSGWQHSCDRAIRTGSAEELQATRDDYQAALLGYLKILDGCLTVMSRLQPESGKDALARFTTSRDLLQKHYESLFPHWQTLEDLEAILLEKISIPNAQLKELAAKHPPSEAWYQEADDCPHAE